MMVGTRTTFVKGYQILSSVLIASEVVKKVKKRNYELVLLKTNFEKAYESMN